MVFHAAMDIVLRPYAEADRAAVIVADKRFTTGTDREVLNLVFGTDEEPSHPALPFFLWGFDSI